jgi:intracellular sulfur oxidation DsrE/DsrF family protein
MSLRESTRRRFVALGAAVGLAGLAGCSSSLGQPESEDTPTEEPATDEPTATPTEEPTPTPQPGLKTVFHFAGEASKQGHALSNVENLLGDDSVTMADVKVVANGRGLLLVTDSSNHADRVAALVEAGVTLCACENSMDALDVSEADLLSGVTTVPAGVGELSRTQAEGYGYIRVP